MPTVVYRARSRNDLHEMRDLLSRNGITSTIVNKPEQWPSPGIKLRYFVDLAVADIESARARQIISEYQSVETARISHLTAPIRRGAILFFIIAIPVILLLWLISPKMLQAVFAIVLIGGAISLSIVTSMKSTKRAQSRERQK